MNKEVFRDTGKEERRRRAEVRRKRAFLQQVRLGEVAPDLDVTRGAEAISLITQLTRESWSLSGRPWPQYKRSETLYRFVAGPPT